LHRHIAYQKALIVFVCSICNYRYRIYLLLIYYFSIWWTAADANKSHGHWVFLAAPPRAPACGGSCNEASVADSILAMALTRWRQWDVGPAKEVRVAFTVETVCHMVGQLVYIYICM